ncbi:MAG: dTMP kinase [Hydrogenothermaceae bacterium]|nr:dTMP kinase [Hydrogenothermaceae bacterium]
MKEGIFITFEGIEASGKTTQAKMLYSYLKEKGYRTVLTREPGGTELGKRIRDILLSHCEENFPQIAELFLYEADRNIHVHNVIKLGLQKGKVVVSDRFYHSTLAYQHYARGIDFRLVNYLNEVASEGLKPDITFLLDLDVDLAFSRLKKLDRIESEGIEFHKKVREGFLQIAELEPDRVVVIRADGSPEEIFSEVLQTLKSKKIIA